MSKYRNFCFTQNNYPDTKLVDGLDCKYIIYGKEVGESGTPHLQGLVVFNSQKTLSSVIKLLPGCHVEVTKDFEASIKYCSKDGDVTERGVAPVSQKRKGEMEVERYERAIKYAKSGEWDKIDADIRVRNLGNLQKIHASVQQVLKPLDGELDNIWLYGAPGCGKTSLAFKLHPTAYLKGLNKWWCGYDNQEVVIIDDMDPFHKTLTQEFKVWAHHYPFPAETKGGGKTIRPKKIIVTSNYRIDEIWEDAITREAMHRRFKEEYIPSNKNILDSLTVL